MRFALVMMKLAIVETLQRYSFSVCKETEVRREPYTAFNTALILHAVTCLTRLYNSTWTAKTVHNQSQ